MMVDSSRDLGAWLERLQHGRPHEIELGLERIRRVWEALESPHPARLVISIAGTNGKGSTAALLESMLIAAGYRVGSYTSPHLLRFNERIRVDGQPVDDATLCAAFERIEQARGETSLTYFEFTTLAALLIFRDGDLDVAVLEVGLGGRLDAVNIIDADAAIVTTVDLDHQDFLGRDRNVIGREKAGVFRLQRPAIIGERSPSEGLLDAARVIGAPPQILGRHFDCQVYGKQWRWFKWTKDAQASQAQQTDFVTFSPPRLAAPCQIDNAAAAIAALHALRDRLPWDPAAMARGIAVAHAPGRLQQFLLDGGAGQKQLVVDVAHNPQAAQQLALWLQSAGIRGEVHAVFGMLSDKDATAVFQAVQPHVDHWHLVDLPDSPRAQSAATLAALLEGRLKVSLPDRHASVADALDSLRVGPDDCVIVFGSFLMAAQGLAYAVHRGFAKVPAQDCGR